MMLGVYLRRAFRFPFHQKKLIVLFSISLLTIGLAAAEESVGQVKSPEIKQLVKQSEKMTRRGELPEAEQLLREVLKNNPPASAAKLALSVNLLKQRRSNEAFDLAAEVLGADQKNSYAYAVLGAILLNAGNFRESRLALSNALALNHDEALGWATLGLLDFYENKVNRGLEHLRAAVFLAPDEPDFVYSLAQVAARAEFYAESANAYQNFLRISSRTDLERRARIKGLIDFLRFLSVKTKLYTLDGARQTNVALELENDRPVIELRLEKNSPPLRFVLDTGAGISVLSESTARRLNIKPVASGGSARGVGGDGKFDIVYGFLKTVYIGDVRIKNVPVYIRKFHAFNEKTDGYIGLSLISKFLTTIDYGAKTFELTENSVVRRQTDEADLSLPLRLTSSGFLSGEVELEGVPLPLNFIVDTGASVSVISKKVSETEEISRFGNAEKMRVIGAAGVTESVPSFMLPRITFGTHSRQSVKAIALDLDLINESAGFEQTGILGGNFLKNYRLTFDFQNSQVVFVPLK